MNARSLLHLILALLLFTGFVRGAWHNALHVWNRVVRKAPFPSPLLLPLVPGAMGAVACLVFPLYPLIPWRRVPLFLDVGCLPALVVFAALNSWQE